MSFFSRWHSRLTRLVTKHPRQAVPRRRLQVELLEHRQLLDSGLGRIAGLTDTPLDRFVTGLYYDLLSRVPLTTEVEGWVNFLKPGTSLATVARGFTASPEYQANFILDDYNTYLGRDATDSEIGSWLNRMQAGLSEQAVSSSFLASQEFYLKQGSTNADWVTGLYKDVLGHVPEAGSLAHWDQLLQNGLPRFVVASTIVASQEANRLEVQSVYQQLLHRAAAAVDLNNWVAALRQGMTLGQFVANIAGTVEYFFNGQTTDLAQSTSLTQDQTSVHLDFGSQASPVTQGYIGVPLVNFLASRGYGWANVISVGYRKRNFENVLTRGFHWGQDGTFVVSLPDGTYTATATVGDAGARHTNMAIWANGTQEATGVNTRAGQFLPLAFPVQISDGQLRLRIASTGGTNPTFALDDLDIVPGTSLDASAGPPITTNEGSTVTLVGSEVGGAAPFTYFWDFGDGTTAGSGPTPSHTYAAAGIYTAALTISDANGLSSTANTTVTVHNVNPSNVNLVLSATSINENGWVSLNGSFTDPGTQDTHQVTVSWGDGSANSKVNLLASVLTFSNVSHQYLDNPAGQPNGSYKITVAVIDKDGGQGSATTSIQVNNVAPTVTAGGPYGSSVNNAIVFSTTVTDTSPIDTAAGFTYAWNFGDGTTSTAASPSHAYAAVGTYPVSVAVIDKDGGATTVATTAVISVITDPNAVFNVPVVIKPDYLKSFTDAVFGTKITRIAGIPGTTIPATQGTPGTWSADARHMYSKDQPWNSNGSLIAIENRAGDGGSPNELFLDGNTYAVKFGTPSNLPYGGGGEERWVYRPGHANERLVAGWPGNTLYWFDVVNNVVTRSWNLPIAVEGIGMGEGNTSQDGRFVALSDSSGHMFVVDMDPQAPYAPYPYQRIGPVYDLSSDGAMESGWGIDWVSVSASGTYVVVEYNTPTGDAERVFDVDPATLTLSPRSMPVSWPGQVGNAAQGFIYSMGHGDLTVNPFHNNEDVMVGQQESGNEGKNIPGIQTVNGDGIGHVVMVQLSNNTVVSLTDPGNGSTIAYEAYPHHISARNTARPGWVYVSYFNQPGDRYGDEIVAVKMDGSGAVERYGDFHSSFDNNNLPNASQDSDYGYRSEAHPVPSPDGTRIIFASNWLYQGGGDGWIQDYVIDAVA